MPSVCPESVTESDSSAVKLKITDHPKVVMMGSAGVGKTAIVHRFLYDKFPSVHIPTVEEMHKSVYDFSGCILSLDLLDTSGSYQFPAMRRLAIRTCDAFILVYSIDNYESFRQVSELRDLVMEIRDEDDKVPIVVVGNKSDLEVSREVSKDITESVVTIDWENGFVEASAKYNINITDIFKAVLQQAHIPYDLVPAVDKRRRKSLPADSSNSNMKRRISLKRNSCTIQ